MMRIALQGSYYGNNFGDVLLLSLFTKWIKEAMGGCEVILPQASAAMTVTIGADGRGLTPLLGVRGLIYSGGGYFGEPPGPAAQVHRWSIRNFYRHIPSGSILTVLGRPTAIIGVGAGPLSNPILRLAVKKLVERSVVVAVRDEESRDFLLNIGVSRSDVEVTADAALCVSVGDIPEQHMTEIKTRFAFNSDNVIGVHLPAARSLSHYVEMLICGIESLMVEYPDVEIVVLSDNVANDPEPHAERFSARYPGRVHVAHYRDPWTLVALLSQLRFVITTKLHVGIVATAVGTLPLSFPFHEKTPRFYRQIGAPELCIPLVRVDPKRVRCQLNMAASIAIGQDYRYELPSQILKSAQRNKELVRQVITMLGSDMDYGGQRL